MPHRGRHRDVDPDDQRDTVGDGPTHWHNQVTRYRLRQPTPPDRHRPWAGG
jgi:hypothetical protein